MKKNLFKLLLTVFVLAFSNHTYAAVVLGTHWDTEEISGYSGNKHPLAFGEFTVYENVNQSHRISKQDTSSGDSGGSTGGSTSGQNLDEHTAYAGLREIIWTEHNNQPCHLIIHMEAIDTVADSPSDKSNDVCNGSSGNEKM